MHSDQQRGDQREHVPDGSRVRHRDEGEPLRRLQGHVRGLDGRVPHQRAAALLHDHGIPAAAPEVDGPAPGVVRHRHQRGLDQRAGQDGAAPLRVQRVEGGGDPPNAHARDRDREQQPPADPRQLDRAGRLPQRDDGGRERWRPEEPDREGEVRREGAGAAPWQGRGYGADGALLRGEPVPERSDGGGGWWIYYCRGRVDTVHVRFV